MTKHLGLKNFSLSVVSRFLPSQIREEIILIFRKQFWVDGIFRDDSKLNKHWDMSLKIHLNCLKTFHRLICVHCLKARFRAFTFWIDVAVRMDLLFTQTHLQTHEHQHSTPKVSIQRHSKKNQLMKNILCTYT